MDDENTRPKKELPDDTTPSLARQSEFREAFRQNLETGKLQNEDVVVNTRGELRWIQGQMPLDDSEPSAERQDKLEKAYANNVAQNKPPYDTVRIRTSGEVKWIIQKRDWIDSKPDLRGAYFENANLSSVNLAFADLSDTHFHRANLSGADLNGAKLYASDLARVNFCGANLSFTWMDNRTNLNGILIDKKIRFRNTRWNDVPLALVDWSQLPQFGDEAILSRVKDRKERIYLYRVIASSYRSLAITLRGQGLNSPASRYRLRGQQVERKALRKEFNLGGWFFSWLLDVLAGYGERPGRIFVSYLIVVLGFAAAYFGVTHLVDTGLSHLSWDQALILSLTSFHGRGFFPGFLSLGDWVSRIAALEAVIGLFIELVLIATFSRRFLGD